MKKIILSGFAAAALFAVQSCKTDFDTDVSEIPVTKGDADFSKYVALGNSLTSGFRDNALYTDGQVESYPNIMAGQMMMAGGGAFVQPLMADNNGGLMLGTTQIANTKLFLSAFDATGSPIIKNVEAAPTTDVMNHIAGPINNMGVPGAKVAHLIAPGYGNPAGIVPKTANPYFVRFASSASTSILADALAQNPTFVSLWIGNNDVLGYATAGGDTAGGALTPTAGAVGVGFNATYDYVVNTMFPAGTTRKGVIANIPYVNTIPFFTTVPYKPVPGTKIASNISALTDLYTKLKAALGYLGITDRIVEMPTASGTNRVLVKDETLTNVSAQLIPVLMQGGYSLPEATAIAQIFGQARQSRETDLILLSTSSVIGTAATGAPPTLNAYGITYPLQDSHVLIPSEITEIKTATDAYNTKIKAAATAAGLAFVDANAKMTELSANSGIVYDGVKYGAKFVTGGTFSLDGVHLTGRGAAMMANEFIKSINAKYKSTLPLVNVNKYSGVKFP